ncbi:MAG: BatD family protein [Candidatus Omnitrophota bacterium]
MQNAKFKINILKALLAIVVIFACAAAIAEDINFEATVDRNKVSLGSRFMLSLNFYGTQSIQEPDLPSIEGFDSQYTGPATTMSIINGKVSSSITHNYILTPLKAGKFEIPSLTVEYNGKTYSSSAIPIEVAQGPVSPLPGAQGSTQQEASYDLGDRIFLVMEADKNTAYINENIAVTIKLYMNKLPIRDIRYPEFEHEGFLADKFDKYKQYKEAINGVLYDVMEFKTNVSATQTGELKIGPASLKCNLIVQRRPGRRGSVFDDDFFGSDIFDDFFGRYETYPLDLKSMDISISALPLPDENVPADFNGAIGDYNFSLEANPKQLKVGDPITLKMAISGKGNLNTIQAPALNFGDDFKVYDPEIKQGDNVKEFEQVIIPKSDKIKQIPEISFSFFNTQSGKYEKITKGPTPIIVEPLAKGDELQVLAAPEQIVAQAPKQEILGRDIIYIKDTPGELKKKGAFLCRSKAFLALQLLPLLAVISVLILHKRYKRLTTDIRYARRMRAPKKARKNLQAARQLLNTQGADKFFEAVFKTLQEYLGDKFHLPTAGITSSVVDELKKYNIDQDVLSKLKDCFNSCDAARYAASSITKDQMQNAFKMLEEIIDELERVRL